MTLPYIDGDELRRLVPMTSAIDALQASFLAASTAMPKRVHLNNGRGDLLVMPAWNDAVTGVKLVTLNRGNPQRGLPLVHGVYVLFSTHTSEPIALLDGAALTALRTPAASALATKYLARADAGRLVIFGAGVQAWGHLEAMAAVRPIRSLKVVTRTEGGASDLLAHAQQLGLEAALGHPSSVAEAGIICTCTTSTTPLFDGALVASGAHINAVGGFKPDERELDTTVIANSRLVVDTREAALAEAGDIVIPLNAGAITEQHIVSDLAALVGGSEARTSNSDITVFKSVGVASEDLAVATAAFEAYAERN
jgi:ornithine cyclodeaminase